MPMPTKKDFPDKTDKIRKIIAAISLVIFITVVAVITVSRSLPAVHITTTENILQLLLSVLTEALSISRNGVYSLLSDSLGTFLTRIS